ncbi:MAG: alpha/beta hydrolase [Terriglobia bacterium]
MRRRSHSLFRYTRRCTPLVLSAIAICLLAPGGLRAAAAPTTLDCSSINSKILGRAVDYCVDLPGDYSSSSARYPTLYFLHGLFENYHAWDENGGKDILDNLLKDGKVGSFIVVLPDAGTSFYVNSYDGQNRYEDFFIQELVPYIDGKYRTIKSPAARGITGVSMGGYGALHLAMRHPDVFGSASAQGAALVAHLPDPLPTQGRFGFYARILERSFGNPLNRAYWDANNPITLAADPSKFAGLKLYFDCGTDDRYGFESGAEALDAILNQHDFPHVYALRPGNHGWDYMEKYMAYAWIFHWRIFSVGEAGGASAAAGGAR